MRSPAPVLSNIVDTLGPIGLRTVQPVDVARLREVEDAVGGDEQRTWRHTTGLVDLGTYAHGLSTGVLDQLIVEWVPDHRTIGLVAAYNWSPRNGTVYLGVTTFDATSPGTAMMGTGLFLDRLFSQWPLRKVFIETDGATARQFAGLGSYGFVQCAVLTDYKWVNDRFEDWLVFALDRDGYDAIIKPRIDARRERYGST